MYKFLSFIFFGILIFFQENSMSQNKLIDEILFSTNPERFKPLDVSSIVVHYIPLGRERKAVISELAAQGFEVNEVEKIDKCDDCDPLVVFGGYVKKSTIPILPDKSYISIMIVFKNGKVFFISASHTKNVY